MYLSGGGGQGLLLGERPSLVRVGGEMGRLCVYLLAGGLVSCIPVRDLQWRSPGISLSLVLFFSYSVLKTVSPGTRFPVTLHLEFYSLLLPT